MFYNKKKYIYIFIANNLNNFPNINKKEKKKKTARYNIISH